MSAQYKDLPPAFYRALKLTPEQREANLRKSPYYDLNKKYEPQKLKRLADRRMKYLKSQIALQVSRLAEVKQENARMAALLAATTAEIEKVKVATDKAKHEAFMKNLRANQAIKEFTANLRGSTAAKPIAAPVAPVPSAADALQQLINKKYNLK
ncbi:MULTISPECIES: hypothetical protein [Pseudomonas]|uniref:hypothetical protein n=1 Tax=Pseudomonas TaxID=286 RepID=UPI0012F89F2F|nr:MULTISPECIES: hypothetical protein [Pseudomonas]MDC7829803.1 hypothetical protein [Pseudomonas benzopyrenica]